MYGYYIIDVIVISFAFVLCKKLLAKEPWSIYLRAVPLGFWPPFYSLIFSLTYDWALIRKPQVIYGLVLPILEDGYREREIT